MRLPFVFAIACSAAALGLWTGWQALPRYLNANKYPLEQAACAFEPVTNDGQEIAPGRTLALVPGRDGGLTWVMAPATFGPDAQVTQHTDGAWSATTVFTVTPAVAVMTVKADKQALLSIHHPDLGWSTQTGGCFLVETKEGP